MKELSIEEKAKAYDEALERAKKIYNYSLVNKEVRQEDMIYLFPELAESDDERIRKEITELIMQPTWKTEKEFHRRKELIDWLEKQWQKPNYCHHEVDLSGCSEEYRKAYYDGWNNCNLQHSQRLSDSNDVVKCLINGMKFYYEGNEEATWGTEKFSMKVKDILAWLEKQKPVEFCEEDEKIRKAISIYLDWLDGRKDCAPRGEYSIRDMVVWLEKKGANSVSVTKGNTSITNVKVISHPTVTDFDGGKCTTASTTIEPKFNVGEWITNGDYTWKIVEVKPLDYVLQSQDGNIVDDTISHVDEHFHSFTIEDAKDGDVLTFKNNIGGIIICKSPAYYDTRSYCRLINDNFIYKEESGWDSTLLVPATKEQCDFLFQKMKEAGYEWDTEKKELKKIEQKPAWSEEDEKIFRALSNALARISSNTRNDSTSINYSFFAEIDWHKSLKDRYIWKPSDEQIEALANALSLAKSCGEESAFDLRTLYEQLKKLREE